MSRVHCQYCGLQCVFMCLETSLVDGHFLLRQECERNSIAHQMRKYHQAGSTRQRVWNMSCLIIEGWNRLWFSTSLLSIRKQKHIHVVDNHLQLQGYKLFEQILVRVWCTYSTSSDTRRNRPQVHFQAAWHSSFTCWTTESILLSPDKYSVALCWDYWRLSRREVDEILGVNRGRASF